MQSLGVSTRLRAPCASPSTARRRRPTIAAANASAPSSTVAQQTQAALSLPDGTPVELIYQPPAASSSSRPAVLLVHGSYHAAWCWRDTFMPYLSQKGYPSYAVSLRGQGLSGRVPAPGVAAKGVAGTLATHAADLASVLEAVARGVGEKGEQQGAGRPPPVACAHSFGGLILQDLLSSSLSSSPSSPSLSGAAYLGSVPPSGNKEMVGRFLKRDPWASAKLTYAFISASFARDAKTCRECFLSREASDALAESVRTRIAAQLSPLRLIDLGDMSRRVPLPAPSFASLSLPTLVLRGTEDGVVDAEAAEELARWASSGEDAAKKTTTRRVEIEGLAHDVMLDVRWEEAARELVDWLDTL